MQGDSADYNSRLCLEQKYGKRNIQHSLHTTTDHGWYFLEGFHVPEIY